MIKKIKKNHNGYCGLILLCFLFFVLCLAQTLPTQASESYIVGTVSVTPLKIELSARSRVFVDKKFNLKAVVENVGQSPITDLVLTLHLPSGLTLISGELNEKISIFEPKKKQIVHWQIQASETETYDIKLTGSGTEQGAGELIKTSASLTIDVIKHRFYHPILQSLLDFFNFIFHR